MRCPSFCNSGKSVDMWFLQLGIFFGALYLIVAKDELVVRIVGGRREAKRLAEETGHDFKGQVLGFPDTYIFLPLEDVYRNHQKRGMDLQKRLSQDNRVVWVEAQTPKSRQKRDFLGYHTDHKVMPLREIKKKPMQPKGSHFNDELWTQEWYLQDTRSRYDLPKLDLNVLPLYKRGITGKGVRVSILDDGIEYTHEDLMDNYDSEISYDVNEHDLDPLPRYDPSRFNSHGTRCAGEVAMAANNGKCGVGIAYNAKIGGVKLLDGPVQDIMEGIALRYANHLVDIYSASWGPNDDGKTVEAPGRLASESLINGVTEGRKGKGCIFVWASGNGGSKGDNCNCDGYLASPFTVSIGSASQKGEFPWYGEECASTLAVTYSSGAYTDQMIATTDLHNQCTIKHTGTSASAPLAAGIIALALEVNPELTWRDVQHLIVWTSEMAPLIDNPGWQQNFAGFYFNTRFGFGLMNAFGLVKAASNWTTVPEKVICSVTVPYRVNETVAFGTPAIIQILTTGCQDADSEIKFLEHVELKMSIRYPIRGALDVHLTSPLKTTVQMLSTRKLDKSDEGFKSWKFMSVMTWGEPPNGVWTIRVLDHVGPKTNTGMVTEAVLILHGTKELPQYIKQGRRNYNLDYNRVHNTANKIFGVYDEEIGDKKFFDSNFL